MRTIYTFCLILIWGMLSVSSLLWAKKPDYKTKPLLFQQDTSKVKTDSLAKQKKKKKAGLPLEAGRQVKFSTQEGTWTSLDVHPNGQEIIFDLLGDLYTVPIQGGKATQVTKGMAFDSHPRYSPDGNKILFSSDKSGAENIWVIDRKDQDTLQLTKGNNQNYPSAAWTPDGEYIVAAKGRLQVQLWMFHSEGGSGIQLVDKPATMKTIDPFLSADGNQIYFSWRNGPWNYNAQLPQYQIGVYDRETGKVSSLTNRYGSAFTPTLSKDGKWLVYGTRYEDQTGLVIRDLKNGSERWLAYPVQRDEQESIATMGVLPAMAFTPDSKFLVCSYGGKIYKIPVMGGEAQEIPFEVDVELDLGPRLEFKYPIKDEEQVLATQIRDAVPSPDGKKLAFTVLNRLYVMDFPNGKARRLTQSNHTEAYPTWSPDGNYLAYASWAKDAGHIYKVNVNGKAKAEQLSSEAGVYTELAWSYTQNRIVFMRGSARSYQESVGPFAFGASEDIAWISANGGKIQVIDKSYGRSVPHFVKEVDRVFLSSGKGLISLRWDGSDEKSHVAISGIKTFGMMDYEANHAQHGSYCLLPDNLEAMEVSRPSQASIIKMAPEGSFALAQVNNDIFVVTVPKLGKTPKISVANPKAANFPARKLTELGGEFPAWSSDGNTVHWSLGRSFFAYDLSAAEAFDDSVKIAKREAARKKAEADKEEKKEEEEKGDKTDEEKEKKKPEGFSAQEYEIEVYYTKDIPQGRVLLKNARIVSMKEKEVMESGDILIENNRIKALGKSGSLDIPSGTQEIDLSGKTVVPGFVDTHAHMWPAWNLHKNQVWIYAANLAYGVTTTRDPQTATTDVLTYADMVEAGEMYGPRIYSTGPGVGFWMYNIKSLEHANKVLKQYSKYYNTKTIKMYMAGNRQQRQWILMAAKEQGLMPTTEGALNFKLNMTQLIDGYPGHEHSLPINPIFKDVTRTIAESQMCLTPTLLVSYGGPWAEEYFYASEKPYQNKKLSYFTPYEELAAKARRRAAWFMPEEHIFPKHAAFIKDLVEAGGLSGVGSHGQLQGLGYHWELWAIQSGGMDNHDALRVATILGAKAIGLDKDLGSIEAGKLADLVILDKNPLDNIRHTDSIHMVMKNGRLYKGDNLDEVYPNPGKAQSLGFEQKKPQGLPGLDQK